MGEQKDKLREKIRGIVVGWSTANKDKDTVSVTTMLNQILALKTEQIDAMLVEARRTAKKQERERILEAVTFDNISPKLDEDYDYLSVCQTIHRARKLIRQALEEE